jgi:hypothetical protein
VVGPVFSSAALGGVDFWFMHRKQHNTMIRALYIVDVSDCILHKLEIFSLLQTLSFLFASLSLWFWLIVVVHPARFPLASLDISLASSCSRSSLPTTLSHTFLFFVLPRYHSFPLLITTLSNLFRSPALPAARSYIPSTPRHR